MDEYIAKPYQIDDLLSTIKRLLNNDYEKYFQNCEDYVKIDNQFSEFSIVSQKKVNVPIIKEDDLKQQISKMKLAIESNYISYAERLAHAIKLSAGKMQRKKNPKCRF